MRGWSYSRGWSYIPIDAVLLWQESHLPPSTLYSSFEGPDNCKRGNQDRILQQHHIKALHLFIPDTKMIWLASRQCVQNLTLTHGSNLTH
jgi:hypothetical protein